MRPWLFLLFLLIFSDIIACTILGHVLWRFRNGGGQPNNPLVVLLALLAFGVATEGVLILVANAFGYTVRPQYTTGYAVCYWIGRGLRSATWWIVTLYLLGFRRRKPS